MSCFHWPYLVTPLSVHSTPSTHHRTRFLWFDYRIFSQRVCWPLSYLQPFPSSVMFSNEPSRVPEKSSLLPSAFSVPEPRPSRPQSRLARFLRFTTLALVITGGLLVSVPVFTNSIIRSKLKATTSNSTVSSPDLCPQTDVLIPNANYDLWNTIGKEISTSAFKDAAIDWLSGAIQVEYVQFFSDSRFDSEHRSK